MPPSGGVDQESQVEWLEALRSLNQTVAETGEGLLGNLFYSHLQPDFVSRAPILQYRAKRDRLRTALHGRHRLLEIGVNGGHSAYLALTANPDLQYHGVDICMRSYVELAVEWLDRNFPGRVFFYKGDSLAVLPDLRRRRLSFDAFHIDGHKHRYYMDIVNSSRMAADGAVAIVDDAEQMGVRIAVRSLTTLGLLAPLPDFPSMPRSRGVNEIRELARPSYEKYLLLCIYGSALGRARWLRNTKLGRMVVPDPQRALAPDNA